MMGLFKKKNKKKNVLDAQVFPVSQTVESPGLSPSLNLVNMLHHQTDKSCRLQTEFPQITPRRCTTGTELFHLNRTFYLMFTK